VAICTGRNGWLGGVISKSLNTFLEECRKEIPNKVIHISKTIDPVHYDATAIIKHLGAQKNFPITISEQPLNLYGQVSEFKLVLNYEISQRKTQIALNMPRDLTRAKMAEACLERERERGASDCADHRRQERGAGETTREARRRRRRRFRRYRPDVAMARIKLEDYVPVKSCSTFPSTGRRIGRD
jgi:hypothetical protein